MRQSSYGYFPFAISLLLSAAHEVKELNAVSVSFIEPVLFPGFYCKGKSNSGNTWKKKLERSEKEVIESFLTSFRFSYELNPFA